MTFALCSESKNAYFGVVVDYLYRHWEYLRIETKSINPTYDKHNIYLIICRLWSFIRYERNDTYA